MTLEQFLNLLTSVGVVVSIVLSFYLSRRRQVSELRIADAKAATETEKTRISNHDDLMALVTKQGFDMLKVIDALGEQKQHNITLTAKQLKLEIDIDVQTKDAVASKASSAKFEELYNDMLIRVNGFPKIIDDLNIKVGTLETEIARLHKVASENATRSLVDAQTRKVVSETAAAEKLATTPAPTIGGALMSGDTVTIEATKAGNPPVDSLSSAA